MNPEAASSLPHPIDYLLKSPKAALDCGGCAYDIEFKARRLPPRVRE
jgi:hypothetical protein